MTYESVDKLQKALAEWVFHYTKDSKKAAGRALGTLIEIITYYLLKEWGLYKNISIETRLWEYANETLTHNVEYTLHRIQAEKELNLSEVSFPFSIKKIVKQAWDKKLFDWFALRNANIIEKGKIIRNNCVIWTNIDYILMSNIKKLEQNLIDITISKLSIKPFAMFECKRVGVEEWTKKWPQTIEKAKQWAYVARTVSSLQKFRDESGDTMWIISSWGSYNIKKYDELLDEVINSNDKNLIKNFVLTVGVVSNHGNWFTSDNPNKELIVLAQSYDWLIFLTDIGLSEFISNLILDPKEEYKSIKEAFLASYNWEKTSNQFTKIKMSYEADKKLQKYFSQNIDKIESWFNIIAPKWKKLELLKEQLAVLGTKEIL